MSSPLNIDRVHSFALLCSLDCQNYKKIILVEMCTCIFVSLGALSYFQLSVAQSNNVFVMFRVTCKKSFGVLKITCILNIQGEIIFCWIQNYLSAFLTVFFIYLTADVMYECCSSL